MARVKTLREKIAAIIRRYKKVNANKFLYNKKSEVKRRYKRIKAWYLIHDEDRGYSIMSMEWKRKDSMNSAEWTRLHATASEGRESLYNIFTQAVLPAINNKGGNNWRFISLLAWAGVDDIRQSKNPSASRKRNRTTKKRNANARRRNRR